MALNKGLKAVGASNEVMAIADKVMNIPSATDFLKSGLDKYASKIKGKATLIINEPRLYKEPIYSEPDPNKKYLIQSAMNRGKDAGGYWDLPGDNNNIKKAISDLLEKAWKRQPIGTISIHKDGRKYKRIEDAYKHQMFLMELERK